MALLRFLLIAILVLYIVRNLAKILLPMFFQSIIKNAQQQQQGQQRNYQSQKQPDAKVKVQYIPEGKKQNIPDSEGDFIDYEEVK